MFIHLKTDLDVVPISLIGCPEPSPRRRPGRSASPRVARSVDALQNKQDDAERLSGVRTDLDSFCDAEAYALMTSGYCMTEYCFRKHILASSRELIKETSGI